MKLFITLLVTMISITARSQSYNEPCTGTGVAMGLSGGYSSVHSMIGTYSVGAMLATKTHVSLNMVVLSELKRSDVPTIGEMRVGQLFNTWELYGGVGYHVAGSDGKISTNPHTGIRPALGVTKYFNNSPWTLSASMSGKVFSLQLGLFGVR
jgi:hypothetical protein